MAIMKTMIATSVLASVLAIAASVMCADLSAEQRRARFQQLLELMRDNGDRLIDVTELEAFLRTKTEIILSRLQEAGFVVTGQNDAALNKFLHRQATFIVNGPGRGKGITEDRLAAFEDADLEYPFVGKMKAILPPPPDPTAAAAGAKLAEAKPPTPIFDQIQQWVSVRKSFLQSKDVGQPALLSLIHYTANDHTREARGSHTVFNVRGGLALTSPRLEFPHDLGALTLDWHPIAVIEANVSTDARVGRDKIVHRLGIDGVLFRSIPRPWWSGHNFTATFDYMTDQDYRSVVLGGTAQYSPNFRLIGIGEYKQLGTLLLFFRWRPYLGLTAGSVENEGGREVFQDIESYINGYFRIGGDLLIGTRLHLTPEMTLWQELKNREHSYGLFSVSFRYSLDEEDRLSVGVSYTRGKDSPEFIGQEELAFGLGIKF